MSKYKRLTVKDRCYYDEMENVDVDTLYARLEELENQIENGTLVELPCKVGDTVYVVYSPSYGEYEIQEAQALGFEIGATGIRIITNFSCYETYRIGNFTNKSQAEARLKELKGEN